MTKRAQPPRNVMAAYTAKSYPLVRYRNALAAVKAGQAIDVDDKDFFLRILNDLIEKEIETIHRLSRRRTNKPLINYLALPLAAELVSKFRVKRFVAIDLASAKLISFANGSRALTRRNARSRNKKGRKKR